MALKHRRFWATDVNPEVECFLCWLVSTLHQRLGNVCFGWLAVTRYGRVGVRMGQMENVKLPVAGRGSRTPVLTP